MTKTIARRIWTPIVTGGLVLLTQFATRVEAFGGDYKVTKFASSKPGHYTGPDSIDAAGDHVFVGFNNGVAKDGTDGKKSTIVEYSKEGWVVKAYHVFGHNDGLRVNPADGRVWAMQNEDANPNLAIIDPRTGKIETFDLPAPHGGGYDDIVFLHGKVYISASNPNLDNNGVNVFPAIVRLEIHRGKVKLTPIVYGNDPATDGTTGEDTTLNLIDPDSLTKTPDGGLIMSNQAANQVILIDDPGTDWQAVTVLPVTAPDGTSLSVDDSLFPGERSGYLLVTDQAAGVIYKVEIETPLEDGIVFSAALDAGILGELDLDFGVLTPVVTSIAHPRGLTFVTDDGE